jgi:nitroimidazol reductase NimA-like FMN-containing flavoprotein (pyridoxamine 5'-phosphate oxidase superfamily)
MRTRYGWRADFVSNPIAAAYPAVRAVRNNIRIRTRPTFPEPRRTDVSTMTDNPYFLKTRPGATPSSAEALEPAECWTLLGSTGIARLAVVDEQGADIFPINYLVTGETLFFRSAPGTKIVSLTRQPGVALETDGTVDRKRWSVVVRGEVRRLADDAEIEASGVLDLPTMTDSDKWNYFEITPRTVTGIRFRAVPHPAATVRPQVL